MDKLKIWIYGFIATIFVAISILLILLIVYAYNIPAAIWTVFIIAHVIDCCFAFYIMNSARFPIIKLCWVFVVMALPLLGVCIFLIFGTTPFRRKQWAEFNFQQKDFIKNETFYSNDKLNISKDEHLLFDYAKNNSFRPIYKHNSIRVISFNNDLFDESIKLIRSAKNFIHIQMYILHDGFFSKAIQKELIAKAKQGVKVRLMYDWVGCVNKIKSSYFNELKKNGVVVAQFNPHGINIFKGATNFRSHRKSIIIDNKKALYGGSNIGDEYLSIDKNTNFFKDLNFIVEGEIVNTINLLFCQDFCYMSDIIKDSKEFKEVHDNLSTILVPYKADNELYAQIVDSSPDYENKTIKNELLQLIIKAKKSIDLISPYFIPTDDIVDALTIASQSGTKIRIIFPGENDNKSFVKMVNRSYYQKLHNAHIELFEFNGFIHSKLMIIDGEYVFTGSYNLDYRSLWINFENAILFKDKTVASELQTLFDYTIVNSTKVDINFMSINIHKSDKFRISFMNVFYPLL